MRKVDTHQHLLYPGEFGYGWTKDFPELQGAFTLEDYFEVTADCGIEGALFMEVDVDPGQHVREGAFFSQLAADPKHNILGVIAKALPEEDNFEAQLEQLRSRLLKGIRRVLHTQPDTLSTSTLFRDNVAKLGTHDLSFDLCVRQDQLMLALALIQHSPNVRFILDHCGAPNIAEHASTNSESWQQWQTGIRAIAAEPNVHCKFSGISLYAKPGQRTVDSLRPYLTEILESFGPARIIWGGDWPVCNLANGIQHWCELTDALMNDLSADEQEAILAKNARDLFKLD